VRKNRSAAQGGFTFIELLVVVALVAVLASIAAPSFISAIDKYQLKTAADNLTSDLQFARFEAIRNNQMAYVNFSTGTSWCYGINLGSACDCTTANSCQLKRVSSSDYKNVTLSSASFGGNPALDPKNGLSSLSGAALLQSRLGQQASVTLSLLGMVGICTPAGHALIGYPSC
jgi:prepilin-type N-terminal cleavage/methylation domain-containing protein